LVTEYVPDIGHIVWLSLDPQAGREQAGRRPFLVLTPREYNDKTSLVVGCPITSRSKGYPFEVALYTAGTIKGVILADHVKSLDWRRRDAEFAEESAVAAVQSAKALIATLLSI
jgi:mRNA interferase MazF